MSYKFTTIDPSYELKSIARTFFIVDFNDDDDGTDYLLPNGLPSFFYIQGDEPVNSYFGDSKKAIPLQNGFYVGYCDTFIKLTHGHAKVLGIVLYPVYFSILFGKQLLEIMNQFVRVEEPEMLKPVPALAADSMTPFKEVFELFEKYMIHQLKSHPFSDEFSKVYNRLTSPGGYHLHVEELATSLGYSTRYLNSRFKQNFGMSPKQFIKMVKFNHALKYLFDTNGEKKLSAIAYEVGYHDQSHFIRDFKSICGLTPKEVLGDFESLAHKFKLF